MTTFFNFPHPQDGSILLNGETGPPQLFIALRYDPGPCGRSLRVSGVQNGNRSEALRLQGSPVEAIKLDSDTNATKGQNP